MGEGNGMGEEDVLKKAECTLVRQMFVTYD